MVTLDLNPTLVCSIIVRAHEIHAKEGVSIPDEADSSSDDWARQMLTARRSDLTYEELAATIDELEPDQQACLVALMWLGRGDYDVESWEEAKSDAAERATGRTSAYLLGNPMLADELHEGLDLIGYSCD
jgi:hypothetical protein